MGDLGTLLSAGNLLSYSQLWCMLLHAPGMHDIDSEIVNKNHSYSTSGSFLFPTFFVARSLILVVENDLNKLKPK